jgi:hypothetical protein
MVDLAAPVESLVDAGSMVNPAAGADRDVVSP